MIPLASCSDVSYNNFSWLPSCPDAQDINTYRSSFIKNSL
ncbi:hypothetical protein NC652_027732 [Populus alba x Populus x berolinensis]|nr:hypothetical protein NC651_026746 [Populus alba x Populus x berolinensis]KAJ6893745.1 hypothetical protein NC652_027723 [Populus alba x Populus x berolinensis]KAJ6893755.1 hypothetical protein NC652_027732 [Populus alba x Populus x berolinensis]